MSKWNFGGSVLNIDSNINADDCNKILNRNVSISMIQLWKSLENVISETTLILINEEILTRYPNCDIRFTFGDASHWCIDFKNLELLKFLTNLKSLCLIIEKVDVDFAPITQYLNLKKLSLYSSSRKVDISFVKTQTSLNDVYLGGNIKNIWVLENVPYLYKLTINQKLEDLTYLKNLNNLRSLHFLGGHVTDLSGIEKIGKIEKIGFEDMRKMTNQDLMPINAMPQLKYLTLKKMNKVTDLTWLTIPNIEYFVINCKYIKGQHTANYLNHIIL